MYNNNVDIQGEFLEETIYSHFIILLTYCQSPTVENPLGRFRTKNLISDLRWVS